MPRKDCLDCADIDRHLSARLGLLAVVALVRLYRATPRRGRCHRAGPSCSAYMLAALQTKGLLAGLGDGFTYWSQCKSRLGGMD